MPPATRLLLDEPVRSHGPRNSDYDVADLRAGQAPAEAQQDAAVL